MQTKQFDVVVFIGRFQPVHNAHVEILKRAAEYAHRVVVIIGSADQPRTYKNPFTKAERKAMLSDAIFDNVELRMGVEFSIHSIRDSSYNDQAWAIEVQKIVQENTEPSHHVAIIGHTKDESSYYLKMFPHWYKIELPLVEPLNASQIRELYFVEKVNMNFKRGVIPETTYDFLVKFSGTEDFKQIVRERRFIESYQKQYASLPYPPIFVTVDAVVMQSGHVLMIKRRSEPGKGLWALPGGFVNADTDKSVERAMLRELREETGIKVPEKVIRGNIRRTKVFDAVDRSARGRTITHAFHIVFDDGEWNLPKIRGGDDAEKAVWMPISEVKSEECFEDHYQIIQHFLGA